MKNTIDGLIGPLESVQRLLHEEDGGDVPDGMTLLLSEMTLVGLIFSNVDLNVTEQKRGILNAFRQAISDEEPFAFPWDSYMDLCLKFVHTYPTRRLSIDCIPFSIQYLQIYDRAHGTEYGDKAIALFLQLATAMVHTNGIPSSIESITLLNFEETLKSDNPFAPIVYGTPCAAPTVHPKAA